MTDQAGNLPFWELERYRTETRTDTYEAREGRKLTIRPRFGANGGVLFWVALRAAFLTILTVGLYRFWMVTRLRRFYWGAIQIDGDPLEYTGRPIEKLLGFLLALVVLAAYLGAVNLGFVFLGLSFGSDDPNMQSVVLQLSAVATVPFIFYATYRGQRYVLARTRWRGIRFGLEPGAFGYTWRALLLSLLTLATLGLAYPYQQYKLAKYITDRAYFGDLRFHQDGGWGELFAQWMWLYIVGGIGALLVWGLVENPDDAAAWFLGTLVLSFGGLALTILFKRYEFASFRILWANRRLGETEFDNDLEAGRLVWTWMGGTMATSLCTGIVAFVIIFVLAAVGGQIADPETLAQLVERGDRESLIAAWPIIATALFAYLLILALAFAFSQNFISLPILRAKVEGLSITNPGALMDSRQRAGERAGEAGGFADALGVDIGAGI